MPPALMGFRYWYRSGTLSRGVGSVAGMGNAPPFSWPGTFVTWSPLLLDLNSTNGVFVNGRAVKDANLGPRDVVRLGDWVGIVVSLADSGAEPWSFRELTAGYWAGPILQAALAPARMVAASDLPM